MCPAASHVEQPANHLQYLSSLIFPSLPVELRTLSYPKFRDSPVLQDAYTTPLSASTYTSLLSTVPPDAIDSLESYALLPASSDTHDAHNLLTPVFTAYCTTVTLPPPIWSTTRTTECELCERDWVPLTYHHLIPKSSHDRVRKRGWHGEESHADRTSDTGSSNRNVEVPPLMPIQNSRGVKDVMWYI
jgi:hypothetical protein